MCTSVIFVTTVLFNFIQCFDSGSFEYSGMEVGPLYETIIYSDIADIISEFDNNKQLDKTYNDSESDEDVEDLLTEYHHYLEKAHKQRMNYLEKNKLKNKVPAIRHEKFTKMLSPIAGSFKDHVKHSAFNTEYNYPSGLNPFNMFIPFNSNNYISTIEQSGHSLAPFKNIQNDESPLSTISNNPKKPPCCKDGRMSCNKCAMAMDQVQHKNNPADEDNAFILNSALSPDLSDDTINIRIKVDVQLPKLQQDHSQFYNLQNNDKMTDTQPGLSKEFLSSIKLPSPHFNFPIPMSLLGYKKMPKYMKHDVSPLHKLTVHKKKKTKSANGNKKHRKKVITFHNIKIEPQLYQNQFRILNVTDNSKYETENNNTVILNLKTNTTRLNEDTITISNPISSSNVTNTQTEENILLVVNITNNLENVTNDPHKIENSIEIEYKNVIMNATTDKTLHSIMKREVLSENKSSALPSAKPTTPSKETSSLPIMTPAKPTTSLTDIDTKKGTSLSAPTKKIMTQKKTLIKNNIVGNSKSGLQSKRNPTGIEQETDISQTADKVPRQMLLVDSELLFWPNNNASTILSKRKNITEIILESDNNKAKLNMSKETLRLNHTRALEQAIFGNIDWNNVDAVAPAFVSFVGKYVEGILTFCNELICHSMKCSQKNCVHRICEPKERFNNKGHCNGCNITDSIASMESITDLPSNIAFEIVEILQDRMIGKLFGKITLRINNKCVTYAVSKKLYYKKKCIVNELTNGHCVLSKGVKVA